MNKTIAWTIAGSDSGGGAGIQADLHTFQSLGVHGCSVITAVTAQNSQRVQSIYYLPANIVAAQLHTLQVDLPAKAIKLGMLGNTKSIDEVLAFLLDYSGQVVMDPVLVASCGDSLFSEEISQRLTHLHSLLTRADVLTPNLQEAALLTNTAVRHPEEMACAAHHLLALKAKSVLIKGGHEQSDAFCQDFWTDGKNSFWISSPRQPEASYHGSGCTLASAITAALALGYDLKNAIVIAKMYVNQGIQSAQNYGQGPAPVAHRGWPLHSAYLPFVTSTPLSSLPVAFPDCGPTPIGFYPIVDRAHWLEKLLPLGVSTIQLRIKDLRGAELEQEVAKAVTIAKHYNARLFINDYWELAVKYSAYGVHLGQEDLFSADIPAIRQANLRLGISTHSYYELACAHAIHPSYIAFGPIYPTTSKPMAFAPQGMERLKHWRALVNYPLVVIGGIDLPKLPELLACGVDGIAVLSAVTKAHDPLNTVKEFLAKCH